MANIKKIAWLGVVAAAGAGLVSFAQSDNPEIKKVWTLLTGQLDNREATTGIVTYDLGSPQTYEMQYEISNGSSLGAGVMVDGVFYWYEHVQQVYGYDAVGLYAYDTEEGNMRLVKSYDNGRNGIVFYSPTYDYQTRTVYALNGLQGGNGLVKVDLETGEVSNHAELTGMLKNAEYDSEDSMKAIAVNYDGDMYGVSYWGGLYKINKVSGECSLVGYLDFNPEKAIMYTCSLAFDNDTDELYWHVYTWVNKYKEVRKINIKDATTTQVGIVADSRLYGNFSIPFTVAEASAPAKVNGFIVEPEAKGGLKATLKWTNPTKTYGRGGTLESLQKIEIYRNNELVETIEDPGIGKDMTWSEVLPESALFTYKIVPYNEAGKGDRTAVTMFIGQGVPMPVTELTLTPENHGARLTWKAPEHGKFDAYLDTESLRYEITRSDGATIATDCAATTYFDATVDRLAKYTYTVKAKNIGGESPAVTSNDAVCGPVVELPHAFTFPTQDDFDVWTVIDGNGDGQSWQYTTWPVAGAKSTMSYMYQLAAHEYFISPKVKIEKDKHYKVTFDATSDNKNIGELIAVSFGKEATPQAQDSINQYSIRAAGLQTYRTSLPVVAETGEYNFGFVHRSIEMNYALTISNVRVEEDHDGSVSGTVKCNGAAVKGVTVATEDGAYSSMTDAQGRYKLEYLPAGTHNIVISCLGYEDKPETVDITELTTVTKDFEITALPAYKVSGKAIDAEGKPVEGAAVTLGGYNAYQTETGPTGEFEIPSVYSHTDYSLVVAKNNLVTYSATIDVTSDVNCGEIKLGDNPKSPYRVKVEDKNGETAEVSWQTPLGDPREVRYDDGVFNRSLSINNGGSGAVFGNINRTPGVLYGCSFYIMSSAAVLNHYGVNLFVVDLDEEGNPTDRLLYRQYVSVTDDAWTTVTLPAPIDCPNGYMVGVSHGTAINLAIDGDGDKTAWPFVTGVNCYTADITTGEWTYLDQTDYKCNFAMRSICAPYKYDSAKAVWRKSAIRKPSTATVMPDLYVAPEDYIQGEMTSAPLKSVEQRISYKVYRGENKADPATIEWKELASGLKQTVYEDSEWAGLQQGVYRYGVKAVYYGGEESPITVADSIGRNMHTALRVGLNTDTRENEAEGARLSLTDATGTFTYDATFDENGICEIEGIWKQPYRLIISKRGFSTVDEMVDLSVENAYRLHYNIVESHEAPKGLKAVVEEGEYDSDPLLIWNFPDLLMDDFEDHDDFAVNSPGSIGWKYIDGDGTDTGAVYDYEWPGKFGAMAFMVFNPYATTPAIAGDMGIYPYSGEKILTDFASTSGENDDWIISPKLYFDEDFKMGFYARCLSSYAPETIQVGYSLTGSEPADFIWINDNEQISAQYWMQYSYDVPAAAKYVAVHCISKGATIFMLDDLKIGLPQYFGGYYAPRHSAMRAPHEEGAYEVYVNGEFVAQTDATEYKFNGLPLGLNTLGVRASYTSGYSPMTTLDYYVTTSGIERISKDDTDVTLVGRELKVTGEYSAVALYGASGIMIPLKGSKGAYDLSGLEKGIYLVTVKTAKGNFTRKLNLK